MSVISMAGAGEGGGCSSPGEIRLLVFLSWLMLNPGKTKVMLVERGNALKNCTSHPYVPSKAYSRHSEVMQSLGVLFDLSLSLDDRVASVSKNTSFYLQPARKCCTFLPGED